MTLIRSLILALVLFGLAGPATASVPKQNENITKSSDGKLYSDFPAGDAGPVYAALSFSLGSHLTDAGIGAIICGTSGTDFSHNIRQWLSGTNSVTAPIIFVSPTGDDFDAEGGTAPGAGSNVTFECASPTLSKSGTISFSATDGTSTATTSAQSWASVGTGTPPPGARDLIIDLSFETGAITGRNNPQANGDYVDAARVGQIIPRTTFTVSNISRASPGVLTWTGADPSFINPDTGANAGITLPVISSGMTQVSRCLLRLTSINNTTNTGNINIDGATCTTSDGDHTLGDTPLNTSAFTAWSGTATATMWDFDADDAPGSLSPSSTKLVHVEATETPPTNLVGSAVVVNPRAGGFLLSATISKNVDYSAESGQGAPPKNKPRWTFFMNNQAYTAGGALTDAGKTDIAYNSEFCFNGSIELPDNYDHNDKGGVDGTENQLFRIAQADAQDEAAMTLSLVGNSSLVDHFNFTVDDGQHDPSNQTHALDNDLGSVTNSIGKWTDFLIRGKIHATDGYVRVYRRYADNTSSATKNETAWTQVYARGRLNGNGTVAGVGSVNPTGGSDTEADFRFGLRNYKFSWLSNTLTTPSWDIWYGFDEIRLTRFVLDGGDCTDVTTDRSDPT